MFETSRLLSLKNFYQRPSCSTCLNSSVTRGEEKFLKLSPAAAAAMLLLYSVYGLRRPKKAKASNFFILLDVGWKAVQNFFKRSDSKFNLAEEEAQLFARIIAYLVQSVCKGKADIYHLLKHRQACMSKWLTCFCQVSHHQTNLSSLNLKNNLIFLKSDLRLFFLNRDLTSKAIKSCEKGQALWPCCSAAPHSLLAVENPIMTISISTRLSAAVARAFPT